MSEQGHFEMLDFSGCNARVRNVFRRRRVRTVEDLLDLSRDELLSMSNCGAKTTMRILQLQAEYGEDITAVNPAEAIDRALENSRRYITAIIAVAAAANEIIENAKKDNRNRYYYRVTTKRFNVLRGALEVLSEIDFDNKKRIKK